MTTLRNRNPSRNCLLGWSAEASSVCDGALKLRAILNSLLLFGVTEADVGLADELVGSLRREATDGHYNDPIEARHAMMTTANAI